MTDETNFMTLPPELRERIYEYIALPYATRRVGSKQLPGCAWEHRVLTRTPAIAATCRLVHKEYEHVAMKATAALEFTAVPIAFDAIIDFFKHQVEAKFLTFLQQRNANIDIHLNFGSGLIGNCHIKMPELYTWALFLIDINLEARYFGDPLVFAQVFGALGSSRDLIENCVIDNHSDPAVRDNIEEIRQVAGVIDKAMWHGLGLLMRDRMDWSYLRD